MALIDFGVDRSSAVETVSVILDLMKYSLWWTLFASDKIRANMEEMGCLIGLLSSVFSFSMISVVMLEVRSTEGSGQDTLICCHGFSFSWIWVGWCEVGVDVLFGRDIAVVWFFWCWCVIV